LLQSDAPPVRADDDFASFVFANYARSLGRVGAAFYLAAQEAWQMAGLPARLQPAISAALTEGSSLGPLPDALDAMRCARKARPGDLMRFMPGAGGAAFAQAHGITGSVKYISAASVSSTLAIVEAVQMVELGICDMIVAGGADFPNQPEVLARFRSARLLADECHPFAADRCGTVLAPGAAAIVLETEASAHARGAVILGHMGAAAVLTESYSRVAPEPAGSGVCRVVHKILGETPSEAVTWIKAHGTGTAAGDRAELTGLFRAFGSDLEKIPLTALKPSLGHTLGACGAMECAAILAARTDRLLPPTRSSASLDRTLPPIDLVRAPRSLPHGFGLFLSLSFGGRCAAFTMRPAAGN
jgi:3-oxoacyl-(acyl-carrier-protein) synthase